MQQHISLIRIIGLIAIVTAVAVGGFVLASREPVYSSGSVILRDLAGSGEYRFDPAELTFSLGDTVSFEIVAETELHSFTVDGLGIDLERDGTEGPHKGKTLTITFDKLGTFPLRCTYHEAFGMKGTITVLP